MAELKTKPTKESVCAFLAQIADAERRRDCQTVLDLMEEATGAKATMWGSSIVGFGRYHYKYVSGREGEWMITGFSPRKSDLTLYIMPGLDAFADLLPKLGKFKRGGSCLYIKRLDDIDLKVLRRIVKKSVAKMA